MKIRGILVASAALGLLAGGVSCAGERGWLSPAWIASCAGEAEAGEVKCAGINGCQGKGECGAPDGSHDCAGKNSCKGKGWVHVDSAKECTDQGGTVLEGELHS